jgi:hypothetical protein
MNFRDEPVVLSSWKDIAKHLDKSVRTVQRWEHRLGLPVRRPNGASRKNAVLVDRRELDAWFATRFSARDNPPRLALSGAKTPDSTLNALMEGLRNTRVLLARNYALREQIRESVVQLNRNKVRLRDHALQATRRW